MDSFNPTTKTQAALTASLQAATAAGNPQITPAHLLMALLTQNDGIAAPLLEAVGVEPATIRTETQRLLDRLPSASGAASQPQLSPQSLAAITAAQHLATEMDDEYVSPSICSSASPPVTPTWRSCSRVTARHRRHCATRSPRCAAVRASPTLSLIHI